MSYQTKYNKRARVMQDATGYRTTEAISINQEPTIVDDVVLMENRLAGIQNNIDTVSSNLTTSFTSPVEIPADKANYLIVTGTSNSGTPSIQVAGTSDAVVGLDINAKSSGTINVASAGTVNIKGTSATTINSNATNWMKVTSGTNLSRIEANNAGGTSTVDMYYKAQGWGQHVFERQNDNAKMSMQGTFFTATASGTGSYPITFEAKGSDSAAYIRFKNQTSGYVNFVISNAESTVSAGLGNLVLAPASGGKVLMPTTIQSGLVAGGSQTGSVTFSTAFSATPIVVATINAPDASNNAYFINISSVSTTGFNYKKWFANSAASSTIGNSVGETFNWIAMLP
jgi:hypothetical protein